MQQFLKKVTFWVSLACVQVYAVQKPIIHESTASISVDKLVLQMKGTFPKGTHHSFFIDADNDPSTGYTRRQDHIYGADYLVESAHNGTLYRYPKNAHGWKWEAVSKVLFGVNSVTAEAQIPLNLLHAASRIRYTAWAATRNWQYHTAANPQLFAISHTDTNDAVSGNGDLQIHLHKNDSGIVVDEIEAQGQNVLQKASPLFTLFLRRSDGQNVKIASDQGWGVVQLHRQGTRTEAVFARPMDKRLPSSLKVTATLQVHDGKSGWDLHVEGTGKQHSLMDVRFPQIALKTTGRDHFFVPWRLGKVFDTPSKGMHFKATYPMGWGATMQYMSYYNSAYGLYFGVHDAKASMKTLEANSQNGGVEVAVSTPVPNRTRNGNDWDFPGVFELDLYHGDWFDAAQIYKQWVYRYADYRPGKQRAQSAKNLAKVPLWFTQNLYNDRQHYSTAHLKRYITDAINALKAETGSAEMTPGMYWLAAHGVPNEANMPQFYPSDATKFLVPEIRKTKSATMVYTNAYLYGMQIDRPDANVPAFDTVRGAAAKRENGSLYTQKWIGRSFARMCPTQKKWQDILIGVHRKYLVPLHTEGIFLDQVTASTPVQCYDPSHGHPLGGGHYWRDGYKTLIGTIRSLYPEGTYIVSEAVNDSLMDMVDGYETVTPRYIFTGEVPAIQAVYGGKAQFIGPAIGTGSYNKTDLYGISAWLFAMGSVQGYYYPHIASNKAAFAYIARLAGLRTRLNDYIANGTMQKQVPLHGNIPQITLHRGDAQMRIAAIQHGVWRKNGGKSIALVFLNARAPGSAPISFSFDFDAKKYGIEGAFSVTKLTPGGEEEVLEESGSFHHEVTLPGAGVEAYVVKKL